jgi:porin
LEASVRASGGAAGVIWLLGTVILAAGCQFVQDSPEQEGSPTQGQVQDAQGRRSGPGSLSGGPDSVETTLDVDEEPKDTLFDFGALQGLLTPYFDLKAKLDQDLGVTFGLDYTATYLTADETLGATDEAASGIFRFYGIWDVIGRGTGDGGSLVWKLEDRHEYLDTTPSAFAADVGYEGIFERPFTAEGFRWTNLYWNQNLNQGGISIVAGFLDVTDYLDVYALSSPWTGFFNSVFSSGSGSILLPEEAALGAAFGAMITDTAYLRAGVVDSNSDPTDPFKAFDEPLGDKEYFASAELGWINSRGRSYEDNTHVTVWHVDDRVMAGTPEGWGANFSFSTLIDDTWMPFVRAGYAEDGGTLLGKSASVGIGYRPSRRGGQLGVGVNWGELNETTFGLGFEDQYTAEVFYRLQVTDHLAVTPDVQYIRNPAMNPAVEGVFVIGVRGRLAF